MKKSVKTGRLRITRTAPRVSIRPVRSPVIAIRVPKPVHDEIQRAAKKAGMTMSEYVAQLITRGQEWQDVIGELRDLVHQIKAERSTP